jgi:predicted RNA-binding Zn-ribbon protein involved in translation (DUF1610 family)
MTKPVLEYMWVKVLEDGKTLIPQFDTETGKENLWNADKVPLSKVMLVPFTIDLAEKVMVNGNAAIASTNPSIEVIVDSEEEVIAGRDNQITYFDYFICDICGWKFQHTDGSKFAKCPQCGAQDDWYCSRCREFKLHFRVTKNNQYQCSECDVPTGLDRTKHLFRMQDIKHTCDYFIRTPTKNVTITDDGRIIIE